MERNIYWDPSDVELLSHEGEEDNNTPNVGPGVPRPRPEAVH
jgi:hypothetical protein